MRQHTEGPETSRLQHRAIVAEDAECLFALNSHAEVMRYTHEAPIQSLEEAQTAIANYTDFETVGFGRWACVLKATSTFIGFCGLKYLPDLDEVDVGYRLFPEYWGLGLATEACKASIEFGFHTLHLERIIGLVVPENVASIRVLEKAGMNCEGEVVYDSIRALRYSKGNRLGLHFSESDQ